MLPPNRFCGIREVGDGSNRFAVVLEVITADRVCAEYEVYTVLLSLLDYVESNVELVILADTSALERDFGYKQVSIFWLPAWFSGSN